jgi:hypothetical protein
MPDTDDAFRAYWQTIKDRLPRDAEWRAAFNEYQRRFPIAPFPYALANHRRVRHAAEK